MSHRHLLALLLPLLVLAAAACSRNEPAGAAAPSKASDAVTAQARAQAPAAGVRDAGRLVVRRATLALEVPSPPDAQARLTTIVEREGGYVASVAREDSESRDASVQLVLRVPSERFNAVLAELRRLGDGHHTERIESEDVTDEYVDLEARLKVNTRLEEQLLELLGTTKSVEAALGVHKELAGVRTEIERIQGRQKLLERQVALASIEVSLTGARTRAISMASIGRSLALARSDAVSVAGGIVVGAIRLLGVLVPVALVVGVPALLVALGVRRRLAKSRA